jgi:hypothetical protein
LRRGSEGSDVIVERKAVNIYLLARDNIEDAQFASLN